MQRIFFWPRSMAQRRGSKKLRFVWAETRFEEPHTLVEQWTRLNYSHRLRKVWSFSG